MNKKWYLGIGGLVIIAFLVVWGIKTYTSVTVQSEQIQITALKQQSSGVERDSAFRITSDQPLTQEAIKSHLQITPSLKYSLKKAAGGKTIDIIPAEPLAGNTIYRFAFDNSGKGNDLYTWAFQTTGEFCLISSLPRSETVDVPINTGIEFTFSRDNFDLNQADNFITSSPKIEGRYEKHQKTLVFVPKSLKPGTLYTVTLKKGLPLIGSNEKLAEDKIVRFETSSTSLSDQRFVFYLENQITEFNPRQIPTFPVSFATGAKAPKPRIEVYRYPDADEYGRAWLKHMQIPDWCTQTQEQWLQDTSKLTAIAGYDSEFIPASQSRHIISLAGPLPSGCYLMQVKAGDLVRQAMFQVSDLTVYRVQSNEQWLFWANDLKRQAPAGDVQVWINQKKIAAQGDANGVVLTGNKSASNAAHYAVLKSVDKELVVPLPEVNPYNRDNLVRQNYWKYLYLDRELYLPGDSVHYWGVITPRGEKQESVGKLTLELWGGDYYYTQERSAEPLLTRDIKIQGNTYSGQVKLPMLKPGYYYMEIKLGKVALLSRGFTVDIYQKPAYKLTITPEKKAVIAGDDLKYRINASFFEGTAVPNVRLSYNSNDKHDQVITNNRGEAIVSYKAEYPQDNYAPYNYDYFSVNAATPETGEISDYNGTLVFPSQIAVRGEVASKNGQYNLTAWLNRVDLSQVDREVYVSEENYLKAPVPGGTIQGRLYKEVWTRTQYGEAYDYINKKTVPQYNYQFHYELVNSFSMLTNGQGIAQYQGKLDKGYSYYLDLTSPDEKSRQGRARVYCGQFYD
ncbi:MAG: Ig-like domain-containing protein, partial [Methanomassiliicoccales archaeon]